MSDNVLIVRPDGLFLYTYACCQNEEDITLFKMRYSITRKRYFRHQWFNLFYILQKCIKGSRDFSVALLFCFHIHIYQHEINTTNRTPLSYVHIILKIQEYRKEISVILHNADLSKPVYVSLVYCIDMSFLIW